MPDTAEAAAAGDDLCLQSRRRAFAEQQIDMADDAGADRGFAVAAARSDGSDAIGEASSPTGRNASGPCARYVERQST